MNTLVRHFDLPSLLTGNDKPKWTKKKALAYNEEVGTRIFEMPIVDEADLLHFFLSTGGRQAMCLPCTGLMGGP